MSRVSEMGCPEVGKEAIGSLTAGVGPDVVGCGPAIFMSRAVCGLAGEAMHSRDFSELLVEGLEAPHNDPLLCGWVSGPESLLHWFMNDGPWVL